MLLKVRCKRNIYWNTYCFTSHLMTFAIICLIFVHNRNVFVVLTLHFPVWFTFLAYTLIKCSYIQCVQLFSIKVKPTVMFPEFYVLQPKPRVYKCNFSLKLWTNSKLTRNNKHFNKVVYLIILNYICFALQI